MFKAEKMSSHHPRRLLTFGSTRKRKEREANFYSFNSQSVSAQLRDKPKPSLKSAAGGESSAHPASNQQLLAGYMAYEYLTRGTLFGQKFDPGRVEAVPLSAGGGWIESSKRGKPELGSKMKEHKSYDEVASILKTDGVHIPGVVNPTQLVRWIQM